MNSNDVEDSIFLFDPDQINFSIDPPGVFLTSETTIKKWKGAMEYYPMIKFPEPEGHWHFKFRMFKRRLRELMISLRWRIFPYHIIHKEVYAQIFEGDEY